MKTIEGKIRSFNLSPKGFPESFLFENGKGIVQINFPREAGPEASHNLAAGESITVTVRELEDGRPSHHPVYEWVQEQSMPQEGVVKQINYARHGEPNGGILETGEFLHLRPEGAKIIGLQVGQKLSFEGERQPASPTGYVVIEARVVNGITLDCPKKSKPKKKV